MRIIFFFIVLTLLYSCRRSKRIDPTALALDKKATKIFIRNGLDKDSLSYALLLTDSAINLQSNHVNFYFTKIMILKQLDQYEKMLPVYDKILAIQNNCLTLMAKGGVFEHLNNHDSSAHYFHLALGKIDDTKWNSNLEKEYFRTILYGVNEDTINFNANKEKIREKFSDETGFRDLYEDLQRFNRKEYINNL